MSIHAVILLKGLATGKRRLANTLAPSHRARLIRTMAGQVVAAAAQVAEISRVSVLTGEQSLAPEFPSYIEDAGLDMNAAVARAGRIVQSSGARSMLVLAADLPFVTRDDIEYLLTRGRIATAVFAADVSGTGTNAMLLTPPTLIQPHFGANSLLAHLAAARRAGAPAKTVRRFGLSHDIDKPEDLRYLARHGGARYAFLVTDRQLPAHAYAPGRA